MGKTHNTNDVQCEINGLHEYELNTSQKANCTSLW